MSVRTAIDLGLGTTAADVDRLVTAQTEIVRRRGSARVVTSACASVAA